MTTLSKGANTDLPTGIATVTVAAAARLDVAALSTRVDGKVRGDEDFVFYNQPTGPGVRHRPGSPDAIVVDPSAVPADVVTIVVTASLDGTGTATTFGAVGTLTATVSVGGPVATFVVDRLGPETALVVVELYRRGAGWKVRAVGQGYADGLAGVATDFGITVDAPSDAPSPALPTPAAAGVAGPPVVNLDRGRVSLRKSETVSLVKTGAPPLETVTMGLGWDPARRGRSVDLDASVVAYAADGRPLDRVFFGNLGAFHGAVRHLGDNLTGQGDGDDEKIIVELGRVPAEVTTLLFTVNSYRGHTFSDVRNAYCRLVDRDGSELVRFDLSGAERSTGVYLCRLRRYGTSWEMTALGEFQDGRTVKDMVGPGARFA